MQSDNPPTTQTGMDRFYEWMRGLGIKRETGWIGGVAAGVGTRLGIDAHIVRGIIVVVAILGGGPLMLLLYSAAWLLLPDVDDQIHLERLLKGQFDGAIVAIGIGILLALLPFWPTFWLGNPFPWDNGFSWSIGRLIWILAVTGGIIWLIVWLANRSTVPAASPHNLTERTHTMSASDGHGSDIPAPTPPPATPPTDPEDLAAWKVQQDEWKREHAAWKQNQDAMYQQRVQEEYRIRNEQEAARRAAQRDEERRSAPSTTFTLIAVGIALIAGAATTLLLSAGAWSVSAWVTGMAVALGVLGLAVVINGFTGRRSGGAGGLATVLAITLVVTAPVSIGLDRLTVDNADWSPTASDASLHRTVIAANTDINLSRHFDGADAPAKSVVGVTVIAGSLDLVVPADANTTVRTHIIAGNVEYEDTRRSGLVLTTTEEYQPRTSSDADHELLVEVWIIAGSVDVAQARN